MISGIVLAGGRGLRLGEDKRAAKILGVPMVERAAALLDAVADDVVIVTRDEEGMRGQWHVIRDEEPDRGPLLGLLSGLRAVRHAHALVLPVDTPLVTAEFLAYLRDICAGWNIVVPRWRRLEPLVGVYARSCIPHLEAAARSGRGSLGEFIRSTPLAVRILGPEEIARFGDPRWLFLNVNRARDLEAAEAHLRGALTAGGL